MANEASDLQPQASASAADQGARRTDSIRSEADDSRRACAGIKPETMSIATSRCHLNEDGADRFH